jgi:hypothetical protein
MRLVIVESPYAGRGATALDRAIDVVANIEYARWALADCLKRWESPIASHLLYTQPGVLKDELPEERALGIAAGLEWRRVAECSVFYAGRGWSPGMLSALASCKAEGRAYEVRDGEEPQQ